MKVRLKPLVFEAFKWFKNGDHPYDGVDKNREGLVVRYFRSPDLKGVDICSKCTHSYHEHGWIDTLPEGSMVCPGDYVIRNFKGDYWAVNPDIFYECYEIINEETSQTQN